MLLLSGPAGSGKTQRVLDHLREAARRGRADVCLVVPTATMAEHLRHQLAREGLLVRPRCILTLHHFLEQAPAAFEQASTPVLRHLLRRALQENPPAEFRQVAGFRGFQEALAGLIDELSAAGLTASELARSLRSYAPQSDYGPALVEVFSRLETELLHRRKLTRGQRLAAAALKIADDGLEGIRHVLLDGFFRFTHVELELIRAIAEHADVTVTLPQWAGVGPARDQLLAMGFEEQVLRRVRPVPDVVLVAAPNMETEVTDLARRILDEAARGRLLREMGVIVRSEAPYVAALRTAFARFGIPVRFYFAQPLGRHPVAGWVEGVVAAIQGGWDLEQLLRAFLTQPASAALDRLEFQLRRQMPAAGMEEVCAAAPAGRLSRLLDSLRRLEPWRTDKAQPAEWAARLKGLRGLYPPPGITDAAAFEQIETWQAHAAAVAAFDGAMDEAAGLFDPQSEVTLGEFWAEASAVIDLTPLRVRDSRHNVVHVMDAFEARQWELPVVFVCGLLEKQFPRRHNQDPLLPDAARLSLRAGGIYLRTSQERDQEEDLLFELAVSRATERLVLSYPKYDARGDETLRSFLLDEFVRQRGPRWDAAKAVRPPSLVRPAALAAPAIREDSLREALAQRAQPLTATGIESFLQCPFQFFGRYVLKLRPRPAAPEERLDHVRQGKILHEVLAEAVRSGGDWEPVFDRVFEAVRRRQRVPSGYRTEQRRLEMLRSLAGLMEPGRLDIKGRPETELSFELPLAAGLTVAGWIDRVDVLDGGRARIIDYKFTRPDNLAGYIRDHEKGLRVQAGLYALLAQQCMELQPAAVSFCAFRREVRWRGWDDDRAIRGLMRLAEEQALRVAAELRQGRIEVSPADTGKCEYCEFADACRVESAVPGVLAGGAP